MANRAQRRGNQPLWDRQDAAAQRMPRNVRRTRGMGPNKAAGHKGGIRRQGSKRG